MTLWKNDVKEEIQLARIASTDSGMTFRDQFEMQKNVGQHIIFDWYFHEKDIHHLINGTWTKLMCDACKECGATVLDSNTHAFGDRAGFTFAVILAESHATCHTWPEYGLATFDIYTCGTVNPKAIMTIFKQKLYDEGISLKHYDEQLINRGFVYNEYDVNQHMLDLES